MSQELQSQLIQVKALGFELYQQLDYQNKVIEDLRAGCMELAKGVNIDLQKDGLTGLIAAVNNLIAENTALKGKVMATPVVLPDELG